MVKFNLVLWTDLVDRALVDFVDKSQAVRSSSGKWVLIRRMSEKNFKRAIQEFLDVWEATETAAGTDVSPVYTLVAAPCCPADNIMLDAKDADFPVKLSDVVYQRDRPTWLMREKDIDIDIAAFNAACAGVFRERARSHRKNSRVVYMRHQRLDAQEIARCMQALYGKSAVSIAPRPKFQAIVDLNPIVAKHCRCRAVRDLLEYKLAAREVCQLAERARKSNG